MRRRRVNSQRGFSLVELSIILLVIGLIVGAVSIGVNAHRSAEYNKIKQKFLDQWVRAYNDYYQRVGTVPGDDPATPTLIVNAAADITKQGVLLAVSDNDYTVVADDPDGIGPYTDAIPERLCQGSANDGYTGYRDASSVDSMTLSEQFTALGIRLPPGRAEGQEDRYVYLDNNGNPQELQVCFQWNLPGTLSGVGNVMVIKGLTPELAGLLDAMVDGQVNAGGGLFREQGLAVAGAEAWSYDNTYGHDDTLGAPTNRDENQIYVLTAHYKMNQ